MAQMRRLTVAVQLAVLVLVAVVVAAPCKGFEEEEGGIVRSNLLAKRKSTVYTMHVEGVLYCRCNLTGYLKPVDAAPLPDAVAIVKCSATSNIFISKTDAKGYFLVKVTLVNKSLARYCKVFVSSPVPQCTVPRQYRIVGGGGAKLVYERNLTQGKTTVYLYTAGFLQLGPANSSLCHL